MDTAEAAVQVPAAGETNERDGYKVCWGREPCWRRKLSYFSPCCLKDEIWMPGYFFKFPLSRHSLTRAFVISSDALLAADMSPVVNGVPGPFLVSSSLFLIFQVDGLSVLSLLFPHCCLLCDVQNFPFQTFGKLFQSRMTASHWGWSHQTFSQKAESLPKSSHASLHNTPFVSNGASHRWRYYSMQVRVAPPCSI